MKTHTYALLVAAAAAPSALFSAAESAVPFAEAVFTEVVNDVQVVKSTDASAVKATKNTRFLAPDLVKTGRKSRAQLTAADGTVARIGSNAVFSFDKDSRTMNLQKGAVLFHSPTGKGGGTIVTNSATASVIGTTIMVSATADGGFKLFVLEGVAKMTLNGRAVSLAAGQMTFVRPAAPGGAAEPGPVLHFDLGAMLGGSRLLGGFEGDLASQGKILDAMRDQGASIEDGDLKRTGLFILNATDSDEFSLVPYDQVQNAVAQNENIASDTPEQRFAAALQASFDYTGGAVPETYVFRTPVALPAGTLPAGVTLPGSGQLAGVMAGTISLSDSTLDLGFMDGLPEIYVVGLAANTLRLSGDVTIGGLAATRTFNLGGQNVVIAPGTSLAVNFSAGKAALARLFAVNDLAVSSLTASVGNGSLEVQSLTGSLSADSSSVSAAGSLTLLAAKSASTTGVTALQAKGGDFTVRANGISLGAGASASAAGAVVLDAGSGNLDITKAAVVATGVTLRGGAITLTGQGGSQSGSTVVPGGEVNAGAGALSVSGASLTATGFTLLHGASATVTVNGAIDLADAAIRADAGLLEITATSAALSNSELRGGAGIRLITTSGPVVLDPGTSLDAGAGNLSVQGADGITVGSGVNFMAGGAISLNAGPGALVLDGASFGSADLLLSGASVSAAFSNPPPASLRVTGMAGDVTLTGLADVYSENLYLQSVGGVLSLDATSLNSTGAITLAGGSITFAAANAPALLAQGSLDLAAERGDWTFSPPAIEGAFVHLATGGTLDFVGSGGRSYGDGGRVKATTGTLSLIGSGLSASGFVEFRGATSGTLNATTGALQLSEVRIAADTGDVSLIGDTIGIAANVSLEAPAGQVTLTAANGFTLAGASVLTVAGGAVTAHAGGGAGGFTGVLSVENLEADGASIRLGDAAQSGTAITLTAGGGIRLTSTGTSAGTGISLSTGTLIDGTSTLSAGTGDIRLQSASDISASAASLSAQNLTLQAASGITLNGLSLAANDSAVLIDTLAGLVALSNTSITCGAPLLGLVQGETVLPPTSGGTTTMVSIQGGAIGAMNLSISGAQNVDLLARSGDVTLDGHTSISASNGTLRLEAPGFVSITGDGTVNGGAGSGGVISSGGNLTVRARSVSLANYVSVGASTVDILLSPAAADTTSFSDSSLSAYSGALTVSHSGSGTINFTNMTVSSYDRFSVTNLLPATTLSLAFTGGTVAATGPAGDIKLIATDVTLDGLTMSAATEILVDAAHSLEVRSVAGATSLTGTQLKFLTAPSAPGATPVTSITLTGDTLNDVWLNLNASSAVVDQTNVFFKADTVTLDKVAFGSSAQVGATAFGGGYGNAVTIRVLTGLSNLNQQVVTVMPGRANFMNGTGFDDDGVLAITAGNYAWVPAENIGDVTAAVHVLDFTMPDFRGTRFAYSKQADLVFGGTNGLLWVPNSHLVESYIDPAPQTPQADILSPADFGVVGPLALVNGHDALNVRGVFARNITVAGAFDFGPGLQPYDFLPTAAVFGDAQDHIDLVALNTFAWNDHLAVSGLVNQRKLEIRAGDVTGSGGVWDNSITPDTAKAGDASKLTIAAVRGVNLTNTTIEHGAGSLDVVALTGDVSLAGGVFAAGTHPGQTLPVSGNLRISAANNLTVSGGVRLQSESAGIDLDAATVTITGANQIRSLNTSSIPVSAGYIAIRGAVKVTLKDGVLEATDIRVAGNPNGSNTVLDEIEVENMNFTLPGGSAGIAMEAKTIGIKNVNFPTSVQVRLKSQDGNLNVGSKMFGAVNFISGVSHDGVDITTKAGIDQKVWIQNHAVAPAIYVNGVLDTTGISGTATPAAAAVHVQSRGAANLPGIHDPAS